VILLANPIQKTAFPVADFITLFGKNPKVKDNAEICIFPTILRKIHLEEIVNICV
jgi:hypothetical protein